ncbi:MAG: LamG-like jellyroll fold domain-containing protein [Candidatus Paceibacterota bacterium]|jgi:prepilin-type N-terminal cleavage/methylation domain-containing protein
MQPTNSRQPKNQKAFTLIELLVVIAIVGILAGMVVVNMSGATDAAKIAKSKAFSGSVRSSLLMNRVSEWKFDEGSGTSTADTIGTNSGELTNGPVWKTGADCVSGGCLSFDGANDYVNCGNGSGLNLTNDLTIEAWVKPNRLNADNRVFAKFVYMQSGYAMNIFSDGRFYLGTWQASAQQSTISSVGAVTVGSWNHIVVTRSGATARTYRNGANVTAISGTHIDPAISAATATIGWGAGWYFDGLIDEVRVYNAALSASRIREDYVAGLDKLLASGEVTQKEYQENLSKLNSTYATSE